MVFKGFLKRSQRGLNEDFKIREFRVIQSD